MSVETNSHNIKQEGGEAILLLRLFVDKALVQSSEWICFRALNREGTSALIIRPLETHSTFDRKLFPLW